MEKPTILFVLTNGFADWEYAYIAPALQMGITQEFIGHYQVKTVALTADVVTSAGGLRVIPDYTIDNLPSEYAGVVLVGGMGWLEPCNKAWEDFVLNAIWEGKTVGGICNGASFLASIGALNNVKHTGNGLDQLKQWGYKRYTGEAFFQERQAIHDGGIVTANGTAPLEFCKEYLLELKADTEEEIEGFYQFSKNGLF